MSEANDDREINFEDKTNGMIFEFQELDQAKAFTAAVKKRFGLDGRVFDNAEDAHRAHMNPFVQNPPVAHIDRPWWEIDPKTSKKEWDAAWAIEPQIEKMAKKFGGDFVGT